MIQVEIELKRIQTFLFQVPRLKAMLGANALVGQTMRIELANLARLTMGTLTHCQNVDFGFKLDSKDPLPPDNPEHADQPNIAYQQGILARDGGRFSAIFDNEEKANNFIRDAEDLISTKLPGVLFDIRKKEFGTENSNSEKFDRVVETTVDIPVLQICTETGQGPATCIDKRDEKRRYLSLSVDNREKEGDKFVDGYTKDMIGLLHHKLGLDLGKAPEDLADIADGGYLALIHADGNNIGARYKNWKGKHPKSATDDPLADLEKEAHGEQFFYSMRVAVRRAVVDAVQSTLANHHGSNKQRLYQPLMLGGDDLVMVCRADLALEFCVKLAQSVSKFALADGKPLTLGMGVAIAKASYPFHRLHELAEELANSAKRRSRSESESGISVVDWQVVTQSSFRGIEKTRRRADLIQYKVADRTETLILNQRPYRILKKGDGDLASLEVLLNATDKLTQHKKAARSGLRGLRAEFEKGKLHGELAFCNLLEGNRQAIAKATDNSLTANTIWQPIGDHVYATHLFDLVDLTEIKQLGNRKSS